jgi:hypothetical protein
MANPFDRDEYKKPNLLKETIKGLPAAFSKVVGQPALRAFAGVASALTPGSFTPTGQFQQELFGTSKAITPTSVGQEFRGGIGGDKPRRIDPALGLFAGLADAIPGGRAGRTVATEGLTAAQKLVQAIKGSPSAKGVAGIRGVKSMREGLESAYTAARASRAIKGTEALARGGEEGAKAARGSLVGELAEKPTFNPLRGQFEQKDVDDLFNGITNNKNLNFYEKISAHDGLWSLMEGKVPPRSQLSLLEDVFGRELVDAIDSQKSNWEKVRQGITDVLNVPRSMMTSIDMSAPLRQGVLFTVTKPSKSLPAMGEMFKDFFSEKNFNQWLLDIPNNPKYQMMKDSGLYIANPNKAVDGLAGREEAFMSNLAEKIPIWGSLIKASSRSYVGYLNKLRVDVFTDLATKFEAEGVATPENLRSLAKFVNNGTGRGDLGSFNRVAAEMNTVFFSPRLVASRFQLLNPVYYFKQPAPVRKEMMKSFAQFVGAGSTVLAIAAANGAEVGLDPRSTDFGKIKVGNTRWDIWGGFQQWVRVFSQVASGQRKNTKGEIVNLSKKEYPFTSRGDVALQFFRGKLAPIPSLIAELLDGQKLFGEELTLTGEIAESTIPLYLQDMKAAIDEFGPDAIFTVGVPGFFGIGTQTYTPNTGSTGNPFNK